MTKAEPAWTSTVVPTRWNGHDGLVYERHPASILEAVVTARRWSDRPYMYRGDRVVTFAEHERMMHRIAAILRDRGVRPGHRVGLLAANSPEWVATFFAILELRAIAVPFNGWWAADEVAHAIQAVQPELLVTDEDRAARVPDHVARILTSEYDPTGEEAPLPWTSADRWKGFDEGAPAVILFTAGTTAFPKGVILSHRSLVSNLQTLLVVARKLPQDISDNAKPSVALVGLPLFHMGAIQLVLVPLMTGSQIIFLEGRFDAGKVLQTVAQRRVTMFSGVPTMMERMLAQVAGNDLDFAALRTVVLGGSPVSESLLDRIRTVFPSTARGVGQTYGLTEAGGVVSTGAGRSMLEHRGSSGRLAPVVEVRIDQPDDEGIGEIVVRSPACMEGYFEQEDIGIDADGWFRTGDLGRVDSDRWLYVSGRLKDIIIRGGENISATRVESVLNEHPRVIEVSVVGLPDKEFGEVVGAVVVSLEPPPTVAELEEFAAAKLGRFEIPTRWWFRGGLLPTNDSGKVLRRQLAQEWLARDERTSSIGERK
jgi:long-chain acyl-CoA synthetase